MEDKYYSRLIKLTMFIFDVCMIHIAFTYAEKFTIGPGITYDQLTSFFFIFSLCWVLAGLFNEIYRINKFSLIRSVTINLMRTLLAHLVLVGLILLTIPSYTVRFEFLLCSYILISILFVGSRIVYKLIWKYFEFSGFDMRQVVIIGATRSGKALHDFFVSHDFTNYHFKGFFDDDPETALVGKNLIKGRISDVMDFCLKEKIDEIYFALPLTQGELLANLSRFAEDNFIFFRIAPDFSTVVKDNYNVFLFDSIPVFTTRNEPLSISVNAGLKRLFDIVFSLSVIVIGFPLIVPLIALAIRLDSKGPIIFKQLRPGKKSKLFDCYKFRTMYVNNNGELQARKNDSRITRVGKFLRKTNLDELPQFVNVLLGNMSVVGPRPNMISQLEEYSRTIKKYKIRHFVTPGITGYAQVNGYRGETREPGLMEKRVEYDIKYMENWSLSLDLKIIALTVLNMFRRDKRAY